MPEFDPFEGTWYFQAYRSELDTPFPLSWVQQIVATPDELVVREHIVRHNGIRSEVRIRAQFDGSDYPVLDFPVADTMAYTRDNPHRISGTGKKDGLVSLNETMTVTPDGGLLTVVYSIQTGASQVARGIAVFSRV